LSTLVATFLVAPMVSAQLDGPAASPTFSRDVAPIIEAHCTPCHRPGQAGPFNLLSYSDVRSRARLIVEVTERRYMPPWKPAPGEGGPFSGDRRLSDVQIALIERWVELGMPKGDPVEPRIRVPSSGWQSGTPDLVVTLSKPFALGADGPDVFRTFVMPVPLDAAKYVAAIEFRPGASRAVHHANIRLDRTAASRDLDEADPLPGFEGDVSSSARYPDGYFLGWTPGRRPQRSASGMAWRLDAGSDLVIQVHLRKTGRVEQIQPSVGLYFTDEAPSAIPMALRLGRQNIDLAPGQTSVFRDSYQLPVDVQVRSIHPHAHYRATDIRAFADLPDGTRRPLIHIPDWDFTWQDIYEYESPIDLPRGTTISTEYIYDNSSANPRNPDRPPRRVLYGQNSVDEMGDLWLQVVSRSPEDRARLAADFIPKVLAEDAVGYGMLLMSDPQNERLKNGKAALHYNLGTLFLGTRRWSDAAAQFTSALELRPEHGNTYNNLGVALLAQGQVQAAIDRFQRAVALDPSNDAARQNLADAVARLKD
jgi:hypothetical protein